MKQHTNQCTALISNKNHLSIMHPLSSQNKKKTSKSTGDWPWLGHQSTHRDYKTFLQRYKLTDISLHKDPHMYVLGHC